MAASPPAPPAGATSAGLPPVVLCGPSGVGKSTLIARLREEFPADFGFSVSHTTRGPRPGEEDGVAYHFTTREAFLERVAKGEFLEHADVHGNMYGTTFAAVDAVAAAGRRALLDIDVQGVASCRAARAGYSYVFVAPPDMASLEARLRGRGTETEDKVAKRLAGAVREMDAARFTWWDAWVVTDDVDGAYAQRRAFRGRGERAGGG